MPCLGTASGSEEYDDGALVSALPRTGRTLHSNGSSTVLVVRHPARAPKTLWSFRASSPGHRYWVGGGPQTVPDVPQRGLTTSACATPGRSQRESGAPECAGERHPVIVLAARSVPSRDIGNGPFLIIHPSQRNPNGRRRARTHQRDCPGNGKREFRVASGASGRGR